MATRVSSVTTWTDAPVLNAQHVHSGVLRLETGPDSVDTLDWVVDDHSRFTMNVYELQALLKAALEVVGPSH